MHKYSLIALLLLLGCPSCSQVFRTQWHEPGYDPNKDVVVISSDTPKRPMNIFVRSITNLNLDSLYSINGEISDSATTNYLVGANIIVLHSSIGCASNYLGDFNLAHLRLDDTLKFQYIGFFKKYFSIREFVHGGKKNW